MLGRTLGLHLRDRFDFSLGGGQRGLRDVSKGATYLKDEEPLVVEVDSASLEKRCDLGEARGTAVDPASRGEGEEQLAKGEGGRTHV